MTHSTARNATVCTDKVHTPRLRYRRTTRVISAVRARVRQLRGLNETELLEASTVLRQRVTQEGTRAPTVQIEAFALMCNAIRRTRGVTLYGGQLHAAAVLSQGRVAEMQTGEGKTLACAPAAYLHALTGRGVHVATPNTYLAQRDYGLLTPAFQALGCTIGLLPEHDSAVGKRAAYLCDVTYGTGYEFGFDYLRDQLAFCQSAKRVLGQKLWQTITGGSALSAGNLQRPLYCSLVDEIDNVLLDDAQSPLVLSGTTDQEATDAAAHRLAQRVAGQLTSGAHYQLDPATGSLQLTPAGVRRIHAVDVTVPIPLLLRSWTEYVESALLAELRFRRDVHYVVVDGSIQIVDASTGRIFSDRTWQNGLHQAIEVKENVRITAQKQALAQITRQRFYRLYPQLSGMTGTATSCEREFHQIYRLTIESIPLRVACRRTVLPTRFFASAAPKWRAVVESVIGVHADHRPVLIGTRSIDDSEMLAELCRQRGLEVELLNGRQDAAEADVVARAGQPCAITIATNLAGRGTDIRLDPEVARAGGLHVIVGECHDSSRVDRQLIGRCARQGDPGSAQTFVSAEDSLIQRLGPWLAKSMSRHAAANGEVPLDLTRQLHRLQALAARQDYAARCSMLRHDQSQDQLFA